MGVTPKSVVDNVITALTSNGMIAPSFWVDPKSGNSYMLTVQYPENQIRTMTDFKQIPLRSSDLSQTTPLKSVADLKQIDTPTEVDHYQLRRQFDIYVMPEAEDLSKVNADVNAILVKIKRPEGVTISVRGAVRDMQQSFASFGIGLILAVVLVYLILMSQFASFSAPFIILGFHHPGALKRLSDRVPGRGPALVLRRSRAGRVPLGDDHPVAVVVNLAIARAPHDITWEVGREAKAYGRGKAVWPTLERSQWRCRPIHRPD